MPEAEPTESILEALAIGRCVGPSWLWRQLELSLRKGQRLGVTGESGAGKTLLLRSLAGLDPIDEGHITFGGRRLESYRMAPYRARVVYLHQRPSMLGDSVETDLRRPFALKQHKNRTYPAERVLELFDALGLPRDFGTRRSSDLSGGEAEAVALVRALILEPQVLLLDEATASLDADRVRRAEALIHAWLAADAVRALIWVTHSADQLERVTDRRIELTGP